MKNMPLVPNEHLIRLAIRQRRIISFKVNARCHMVEPYALGLSPCGEHLIHAYDLGGEEPWGRAGWRIFQLNTLVELELSSSQFVPVYRQLEGQAHISRKLLQVQSQRPQAIDQLKVFQVPSIRRRRLLSRNRRDAPAQVRGLPDTPMGKSK
mgnify:CR=1 FL=1